MKFKVTTAPEALQESGGSSYISKSGVYDVTIKFASVDVTRNGAEQLNFNLDYNGNDQTIYGPYVTNKDGNVNEIGAKLVNKLAIVAGMTDGDDFEIEQEEHVVGKDKTAKEFACIQQFSDLPVKIRLQEEYYVNNNTKEIAKKMVVKSFFTSEGTSADEIVAGADAGKRLALELEKYASNVTYKDDLTPELVQAWKDSKKSNAQGGGNPAPQAKPAAKPAGTVFK